MSWTYTDAGDSTNDAIRFEAGLTNTNDQLVTDEEIEYCYDSEGTVFGAAARACEAVASLFSREVSSRVGAAGEFRLDLQQKALAYERRAKALRRKALSFAVPYAVSISKDRKEDQEDDTDRVRPVFIRDQFEPEGTDEVVQDWN